MECWVGPLVKYGRHGYPFDSEILRFHEGIHGVDPSPL